VDRIDSGERAPRTKKASMKLFEVMMAYYQDERTV
jgi:hypothetical protein